MNAPGKGLLKVVSILFIIGGALVLLLSLLAVGVTIAAISLIGGLAILAVVGTILLIIVGALELILGIVGLKKCGDPAQGGYFITTGIILCALSLVSIILGLVGGGTFDVSGAIGFVLPILYIVGGNMNKKAVPPMAPPAA